MTGFAGTGRLAKLAFRRDIVMLPGASEAGHDSPPAAGRSGE